MEPSVFPVVVVVFVSVFVVIVDGLGVRGCCCMRSATISPILLVVLGVDTSLAAIGVGGSDSLLGLTYLRSRIRSATMVPNRFREGLLVGVGMSTF